MSEPYDRMNPNLYELIFRLEEYSKIDYGHLAYSLSSAEAKALVQFANSMCIYQMSAESREKDLKLVISRVRDFVKPSGGEDMFSSHDIMEIIDGKRPEKKWVPL